MSVYSSSKDSRNVSEAFQKAEFYAEDQLIEISPMVRSGVVSLLCGNFGPFEPSITSTVPLWLAVALKKVHRCKIIPPRWLTLDRLRFFISSETDNEEQLHDIPFHFFEVASLLLHHAPDDMDDAPKVRRYVEDLANARDSKMRRWMQAHVRDRVNAVKINHLTLHEIHVHRPILTEILDDLYAIHVKPDALASQSESQQPPQQQQGTPSNSQTPTAGGGQQQGSALRRGGPVDSAEDASTTTGEPQGQGHRLRRVIRGNT